MELPKVPTTHTDYVRNVTITVFAYRSLSNAEFLNAVDWFKRHKGIRKFRANTRYEFTHYIGANGR